MTELKVRLMERMLGAELTEHLGYEPHGEPTSEQTNWRNGATRKVLKGNDGAVPIKTPRDRRKARPGSTGWMTRSFTARAFIF
jgi:putative transposase